MVENRNGRVKIPDEMLVIVEIMTEGLRRGLWGSDWESVPVPTRAERRALMRASSGQQEGERAGLPIVWPNPKNARQPIHPRHRTR